MTLFSLGFLAGFITAMLFVFRAMWPNDGLKWRWFR